MSNSGNKRNAVLVMVIQFFYFISYMCLKPYLKSLLNAAGASDSQTGIILALFGAVQVVSALFVGQFLQKYGQKVQYSFGCLLAVIISLSVIFSNNIANAFANIFNLNVSVCEIAFLTICNVLFGFTHGILILGANYVLTSLKADAHRDAILGLYTFFEALGQFVGPILAAILLSSKILSFTDDYRRVVCIAVMTSLVAFILSIFVKNIKLDTKKKPKKVFDVFKDKPLMRIIILNGAFYFANDVSISYTQDFGVKTLGLTLARATFIISVIKFSTMIIRFLLARLIKLMGTKRLFKLSMWVMAVTLLLFGLVKFISQPLSLIGLSVADARFYMVVLIAVVYGASVGLVNPLALIELADASNETNRTPALALRSMVNYGGQTVGEIVFGLAAQLTGALWPVFVLSSSVLASLLTFYKRK